MKKITFKGYDKIAARLRLLSFWEFSGRPYGSYRVDYDEMRKIIDVPNYDFDDDFLIILNAHCLDCGIFVIELYDGYAIADIGLVGYYRSVPTEIIEKSLTKTS